MAKRWHFADSNRLSGYLAIVSHWLSWNGQWRTKKYCHKLFLVGMLAGFLPLRRPVPDACRGCSPVRFRLPPFRHRPGPVLAQRRAALPVAADEHPGLRRDPGPGRCVAGSQPTGADFRLQLCAALLRPSRRPLDPDAGGRGGRVLRPGQLADLRFWLVIAAAPGLGPGLCRDEFVHPGAGNPGAEWCRTPGGAFTGSDRHRPDDRAGRGWLVEPALRAQADFPAAVWLGTGRAVGGARVADGGA